VSLPSQATWTNNSVAETASQQLVVAMMGHPLLYLYVASLHHDNHHLQLLVEEQLQKGSMTVQFELGEEHDYICDDGLEM